MTKKDVIIYSRYQETSLRLIAKMMVTLWTYAFILYLKRYHYDQFKAYLPSFLFSHSNKIDIITDVNTTPTSATTFPFTPEKKTPKSHIRNDELDLPGGAEDHEPFDVDISIQPRTLHKVSSDQQLRHIIRPNDLNQITEF
jgi:hypothetical protein